MPTLQVYVTDEEYAALARLALPGEGAKDVLKRYAELTVKEDAKPKRRKA
jgi:hypothetical protein